MTIVGLAIDATPPCNVGGGVGPWLASSIQVILLAELITRA
jgi:hypothetical protein